MRTTLHSQAARISAGLSSASPRMQPLLLLEEGFSVNHHKTRIMRRGVRQMLAGLVVNEQINLRRADLKCWRPY